MSKRPFEGRTIQLVRNFSIDEQRYLYKKAHICKRAFYEKDYETLTKYSINDPAFCLYLLFQENSTRTKESFRNAAQFHNIKVNDFKAESSSFQKQESLTDTVRMLMGYSLKTGFVVRSSYEGACTWLNIAMKRYAEKQGIPASFFINAGDGRHEHPTQEFLDEFTFLETLNNDCSHIHIALIGDLFHGRTVHSKKDGLRIFNEVEVDLIAPLQLAMPAYYIQQMQAQGFSIRIFSSLEEYLAQKKIAPLWYFTRIQIERMGDDLTRNIERLQNAVIFKKEYLSRVSNRVKFFHPLPRNKKNPTIPSFLDETSFNGWDAQSTNGYHVRFVLLGMLSGLIGEDFDGISLEHGKQKTDFIQDVTEKNTAKVQKLAQNFGIKPIENGVVIDHIGAGQSIQSIWNIIDVMRRTLHLNRISSHGVFSSIKYKRYKGIISISDYDFANPTEIKKIGVISSGCTINIIENSKVIKKLRVTQPDRIYNFSEIHCRNSQCISHPANGEPVYTDFYRDDNVYICSYCETVHKVNEIWSF